MNNASIPGNGPEQTEQDLWRQFESTGSVQEYLRYRQLQNMRQEERPDAEYGDGAGSKGDEGR